MCIRDRLKTVYKLRNVAIKKQILYLTRVFYRWWNRQDKQILFLLWKSHQAKTYMWKSKKTMLILKIIKSEIGNDSVIKKIVNNKENKRQ